MEIVTTASNQFPAGFIWGAATASYQIEGGWDQDGKGESIWDRFAHTPGRIRDGSTGDVACDHYHRWAEDVELMRSIGLGAYRFSISWPRIIPEGRGEVNQKGLDFYSQLVDALLEAGIEPYPTLYHWDLPQALQDEGGWAERETVGAFLEYVDAITAELGDRVKNWITINEPWVAANHGYFTGAHAPGRASEAEYLRAAHHLLLAHGRAVPLIRSNSQDARTGIALSLAYQSPASDAPADVAAARIADGRVNRWYLEPLAGRGYPTDVIEADDVETSWVESGDFDTIAVPTDFLGINYYSRNVVGEGIQDPKQPGSEYTEMGWEVYPEGLTRLLERLHAEYEFGEYIITENGAAFPDEVKNGRIADERRIRYLDSYLRAILDAIKSGVPVTGNFVWSLLDNFEWGEGYTKRFGLVYVDFDTQERIIKDSGHWYERVIEANGLPK